MKENILIVSAVIYPRLSPRAHRATELAKELAKQGHSVTLAAQLGNYDYSDFEKENNLKIEDIGSSKYVWVISERENRKLSLFRKGLIYLLRKPFLFPDITIAFRVAKYLKNKQNIDRLITIAIPYPVHFGAMYAKKHNKNLKQTKWISDCGDPFTHNKIAFYFKKIKRKWEKATDNITIPTEKIKKFYSPEVHDKIKIIPQGFSFSVQRAEYKKNEVVTFAYSGMVYPGLRDPRNFLTYLTSLPFNFKFVVYTNNQKLFEPFISHLGEKIEIRQYVEHNELIYELSKMDFLINIFHKDASPSKMIDYMLARRPILEITSDFQQQEEFNQFLKGDYQQRKILNNFEDFNIKNIATQFLNL